jgi:hypothetical protein
MYKNNATSLILEAPLEEKELAQQTEVYSKLQILNYNEEDTSTLFSRHIRASGRQNWQLIPHTYCTKCSSLMWTMSAPRVGWLSAFNVVLDSIQEAHTRTQNMERYKEARIECHYDMDLGGIMITILGS